MFIMISYLPLKYIDPGNHIVTIKINGVILPDTLVDLGVAFTTITFETMTYLQLQGIKPTPIILELVDKSIIKPMGNLEDIVVTIYSCKYPIDFIFISPKQPRHPIVLGCI